MIGQIVVLAVLVVLIGVLVIALFGRSRDTRTDPWLELAERAKMTFEPQNIRQGKLSASVHGRYCGRQLTLDTIRGGGELQTLYTRIQLPVNNPEGNYLSITKKNLLTRLVSLLGVQYTEIGDETFDRRFVVLSRPRQLVKSIFKSLTVRERLLQSRSLEVKLLGDRLIFEVRGFVRDIEYLQFLFRLICDFADAVEIGAGGLEPSAIQSQT